MINIFRFLLLSLFFQTLYVRGDLGDLVADKGARMELFADVDNDGDGDVSVEEVIRYVLFGKHESITILCLFSILISFISIFCVRCQL